MSIVNRAALGYLNQWCRHDRQFVQGIAVDSPDEVRLDTLQEAANFYGVSRSLPVLKPETHRLERALHAIFKVPNPKTEDEFSAVDAVEHLANEFKATYGRYALSAASKLLWLRFRSPIVIYDAPTHAALTRIGQLADRREYNHFLGKWSEQFDRHREEIATACKKLTHVRDFSAADAMSDDEFENTTAAPWFHERVFDHYLWSAG